MNVSLKKFIFVILIGFWIFIAFFNVLYNSFKTVSEIKEWVPLSDSQKRYETIGDSYNFSAFINAHTQSNAKILFYSETGLPYFYARYYSYPRKLYWYENNDPSIKSTRPKKYDVIAFYDMRTSLNGYTLLASISAKQSGYFGSLYKRK
jgi:hypothetical protein